MQPTKQVCQQLAKASKELKHYYQEKSSFETGWVAELRLNSRTDPYKLVNSLTGTHDHVEKKFATRICDFYHTNMQESSLASAKITMSTH